MLAFGLFRDHSFDSEALVADFADGRVESALARLAEARGDGLAPPISKLEWWPRAVRAPALSALLATPAADLLESSEQATFLAPLGNHREAPTAARLREARIMPLMFEMTHIGLDLLAMRATVPAGATTIPFDVALLPGTDYQITLRELKDDGSDGPITALASFHWSPDEEARTLSEAMATAHDLALPSHEGSSLLSALVALGYDYTDEAITRLTELEDAPGYAQIARELHALALQQQGLDWSASQLLLR